jgi:glycosyltransferase involved in cell wall biosynthesis
MQRDPVISVVIPCYNAERWIAATLRSVLNQDWEKLEVIVVDDGSADASAGVVERDFPQVKLLRQKNRGVAAARNRGIKSATGEWIAFVDADDIWLPGKLTAQWAALRVHPESRLAYTAWQVWHSTEPEPASEYLAELDCAGGDSSRWAGASGWIYPELLQDCVVWTSTVLVRRALLEEVGCFDETLHVGEDYDLWLKISRHTPILRVSRPFALYRSHADSITRKAPERNYQAEVISRAIDRWGYMSPDGRIAARKSVERTLARSWRGYAGAQIAAGEMAKAWRGLIEALRLDCTSLDGWQLLAGAFLSSLTRSGKRVWRGSPRS